METKTCQVKISQSKVCETSLQETSARRHGRGQSTSFHQSVINSLFIYIISFATFPLWLGYSVTLSKI